MRAREILDELEHSEKRQMKQEGMNEKMIRQAFALTFNGHLSLFSILVIFMLFFNWRRQLNVVLNDIVPISQFFCMSILPS